MSTSEAQEAAACQAWVDLHTHTSVEKGNTSRADGQSVTCQLLAPQTQTLELRENSDGRRDMVCAESGMRCIFIKCECLSCISDAPSSGRGGTKPVCIEVCQAQRNPRCQVFWEQEQCHSFRCSAGRAPSPRGGRGAGCLLVCGAAAAQKERAGVSPTSSPCHDDIISILENALVETWW